MSERAMRLVGKLLLAFVLGYAGVVFFTAIGWL